VAKHKDSPGQSRFDYSFATRRAIFRQMNLPHVSVRLCKSDRDRGVPQANMYLVLLVIDDHGQGCWPSIKTIADETKLSRKAVALALKALQKLDLLCVEERFKPDGSQTSNGYTIPWARLEALCPPIPRGNGGQSHGGTAPDPTGDQELPIELPIEPPPPTPKPKRTRAINPWKEVEEAFINSGMDDGEHLVSKLQRKEVLPAEAMRRLREFRPAIAEAAKTGKIKSEAGTLYRAIESGRLPRMVAPAKPAVAGYPEWDAEYWPTICAMSLEEQAELLPDDRWRDDLKRLGTGHDSVKFMLVDSFVRRNGYDRPHALRPA
jgi:hypothetical protein